MRRKKFRSRLTPQYGVITVCRPEQIDGISLKFRDLHTIYSIMLDYTDRYFRAVEEDHARCDTALDLEAPITPRARELEGLIRIMFSAYLATFNALTDYVEKAMLGDAGKRWLENEVEREPLLRGFRDLRNIDLHDEALHTLIGMRFRILEQSPQRYSDVVMREGHIHSGLAHEGVGFFPWALAALPHFAKRPGLVDTLTFESIIQLAHNGIEKMATLVSAAIDRSYLTGIPLRLRCEIKHQPGSNTAHCHDSQYGERGSRLQVNDQ